MENDAEHSYALAMVGWYLAPYFPELSTDQVIKIGLAHDLVELHAGDVYAYDTTGALDGKEVREKEAFHKLQTEWADFPEMLAAIEAYKSRVTPEAKFVYALDKILPALLDYINEGRGWREFGITAAMFRREKDKKVPVSPEINDYMEQLHALLAPQLHLFAPEAANGIDSTDTDRQRTTSK